MRGVFNVASAVLFTALILVLVAFVWSILAPVIDSMRHVDPPWTIIDVGNVVNFRESVIPIAIDLTLTCKPADQTPWEMRVWVLVDRRPGKLLKLIVQDGRIVAVFEQGYFIAYGASVSVNYMYKAKYLQVVYTELKIGGQPVISGEPIYGGPIRIETAEGDMRVVLPSSGGKMTCTLKHGDKDIYSAEVNWAYIYNMIAEIR